MRDALILGMLKLQAMSRLAHDDEGATAVSYAFIAALVVGASYVAVRVTGAGFDRLLQDFFYFMTPD
ncbi:MAG: hypothetical protein Tsb0032_37460 [Kiloniellaceae bacterium]